MGDDKPAFNFPSFFVAASDEIFDRLKNKFYEKTFNLLRRMSANVPQKIDDRSFRFYTDLLRHYFCDREIFLDIKKAGDITHRLLV